MKKRFLLVLILGSFLYAQDEVTILEEAKKYEANKEYEKAMLLYKKLANIQTKKPIKANKLKTEIKPLKKSLNTIEDKQTKSTIEQMLAASFDIYAYKENYFFPISYGTKTKDGKNTTETKFQLSIKKPIVYDFFGLNETFYFGYTQTSWWQLYEHSSPFRETNYKPEVFVTIPYGKKDKTSLKGFKAGFLHESNGQDEEKSRSWNRVYLESYFQLENLFVIPKVWYRIKEDKKDDDNHDIEDYLGYGDLSLIYPYKDNTFKLLLRNNLKINDNKGYAQFDWTFPFLNSKHTFAHIQLSSGYGESLIDYDKDITRINFGISLSR